MSMIFTSDAATCSPGAGRARAAARGFTLLEVLIAIVIFSIGLLGIATMQIAGMKQTFNSHVRAVAVASAEDMTDRMRANPTGLADGNYDVGAGMPTSAGKDCGSAQCSSSELATYDLVQWNAALAASLPQGAGIVCRDPNMTPPTATDFKCPVAPSGDVYAVKVRWAERGLDKQESAVTTKSFILPVKPW